MYDFWLDLYLQYHSIRRFNRINPPSPCASPYDSHLFINQVSHMGILYFICQYFHLSDNQLPCGSLHIFQRYSSLSAGTHFSQSSVFILIQIIWTFLFLLTLFLQRLWHLRIINENGISRIKFQWKFHHLWIMSGKSFVRCTPVAPLTNMD